MTIGVLWRPRHQSLEKAIPFLPLFDIILLFWCAFQVQWQICFLIIGQAYQVSPVIVSYKKSQIRSIVSLNISDDVTVLNVGSSVCSKDSFQFATLNLLPYSLIIS